jgi:hypothetical protein
MPAGVSALTPLANITLSTTQTTVTFSSISGAYRDLRVVLVAGVTSGGAAYWRMNNDSSSTYLWHTLEGNGSTASATYNGNNYGGMNNNFVAWPSGGSPMTFVSLDVMDYSLTDKFKPVLSRTNAVDNGSNAMIVHWPSTAAINTITFTASGSTWVAGSTFALYGVSA